MLSIVTPVLNYAQYISKNIESVQALSIPHEHIIVDGGSTDGTLDVLVRYPHLKVVRQKAQSGMYGGINEGFAVASGKYFAYVNADDLVEKDGFEAMYDTAILQFSDLVYSDCLFHFSNENRFQRIRGRKFAKYFLQNGIMPFAQPSSIYSANLFRRLDGFNHTKFRISGDLDFFQRMTLIPDIKFLYVPKVSTIFLKHGDSLGDRSYDRFTEEKQLLQFPTRESFWVKVLYKVF